MAALRKWTKAEVEVAAEYINAQREFWDEVHRVEREGESLDPDAGLEEDSLAVLVFRHLARLHPEVSLVEFAALMRDVCLRLRGHLLGTRPLHKTRPSRKSKTRPMHH
ncbi:MAG: hypothetical protein E6G97_22630 [Alphaproteobacteria bacterium]|nr:MAG: hypothetical protein E6G97_22630 [Alphaproteobacteria bacterium]